MPTLYTPGPWILRSTPKTPRERALHLTSWFGIGPEHGPDHVLLRAGRDDIQAANAKLITATPDITDAARMAFENLDAHIHGRRPVHNDLALASTLFGALKKGGAL